MIVLQVDMDGSFISLINRGMPYPILLDGDKSVYITEKRASAFSLENVTAATSVVQLLAPGQSIILYSDGLLDLVPENEILPIMQRLSRMFKGDSRAIGRNLIRYMEKTATQKEISDDVSFLIISKAKKGK